MVHRQHGVGVIEIFRLKQGIGRQRPVKFHPLRPQLVEHRNNSVYLFRTHMTAFARVRIQSADQNARFGNTKFGPQIVMQNSNHFVQKRRGDSICDIAQR